MTADTVGAAPATQRLAGALITASSAVVLGLSNVVVPSVYAHGGTPAATLLLRFLFLTGILLAALPMLGKRIQLGGRGAGWLLAAGAVSSVGSVCLLGAFALMPVSLAILIVYLYPILTAIFTSIATRRPVGLLQIACLLAAFGGLAIALWGGLAGAIDPRGIAIAALGATGFSLSFVGARQAPQDADPMQRTLLMSIGGTLLSAITSTGLAAAGLVPFGVPSLGDGIGWAGMLMLSVCFSYAYFAMYRGSQMIGPTAATMIMNLEVVATFVLAALLLNEALDARRLIGGAIVLAAVIVSQALSSREP